MESSQSRTLGIVTVVSAAHIAALLTLASMVREPSPPVSSPVMLASLVAPPPVPQTEPVAPLPEPTPPPRLEPKPKPKPKSKSKSKSEPKPEPVVTPPPPQPVPEQTSEVPQPEVTPTPQPPITVPPRVDASGRHNKPPAYPALSRRMKEEGEVILKLRILRDGRVAAVRIHESSGYPRLDRAAVEAVRYWRYQPATVGGEAIEYDYLQPIEFRLR